MQGNEVRCCLVGAEKLADRSRQVGVAKTMESVLAQAVLLSDILIDWVRIDVLGDCDMELSVKAGYVGGVLELLLAKRYNGQCCPRVQWCQVGSFRQGIEQLLVDQLRLAKALAVHNSVANETYVVRRVYFAQLWVLEQYGQHGRERLAPVQFRPERNIIANCLMVSRVVDRSGCSVNASNACSGYFLRSLCGAFEQERRHLQ